MSITLPVLNSSSTLSPSDRVCTLNPSKIIAVGLNYRDHIRESLSAGIRGVQSGKPDFPVLFNKTPNVLAGSGQAIPLPLAAHDQQFTEELRTDYEGELVVIMGQTCRHVPESGALDHVYGYTCGIDVSQRNIQNSDPSGWFRGKSFDGFGPAGPAVLPARGIDPQNLQIETRLNGTVVQSSSTSMMIFTVSQLVSYISRQFTLLEGDLIFTGTPSGVGPLAAGDRIEVEIEHIGVLSCPVTSEVQENSYS